MCFSLLKFSSEARDSAPLKLHNLPSAVRQLPLVALNDLCNLSVVSELKKEVYALLLLDFKVLNLKSSILTVAPPRLPLYVW